MDLSAKHEAKYQYWHNQPFKGMQRFRRIYLKMGLRSTFVKNPLTANDKMLLVFYILDKRDDNAKENTFINLKKAKEIVMYKK